MIKDEVKLDIDRVIKEMTEIDMDDAMEVEERIVAALEPTEREWFTITAEDETQVLSQLLSYDDSYESWALLLCEQAKA